MGSRKIESFAKVIPEWEFTLRFQIDDKEHYCMRSTCNQNKIEFNGEILKPKEVQERLRELCFGLKETPKDMTWTTLFQDLLENLVCVIQYMMLLFLKKAIIVKF